jgi:ABC-type multidrug transport system fused ATPase/permease subunit
MTVPPLFARKSRPVWAGLAALALAQAGALVAGVAGTRLAFGGLDAGGVPGLAVGLIVGAALALAILRPGLRLLAERLGQDQTAAIRAALYRQAMTTAPEAQTGRRRSYLMLRLTGDMTAFKDGLSRTLPPFLQGAALIPAAVLALALIDLRFGLAGFAVAAVALATIALSRPYLREAHAALRSERAKLVADMAERLPIAYDLAHLGRRQSELSRLEKASRSLHRKAHARLLRIEILRALPGGAGALAAVAVLLDGAGRGVSAGEIAAALAAIGLMVHAIVELATAVDLLTGWQVARKNLARHLAEAVPEPAPGQVRLARGTGALTVSAGEDVLRPARLHLSPGDRADVSAVDPDRTLRTLSGQISDPVVQVQLDGIAMADLSPGSLRRSIGVLGPSPVLLKGSVRRNICLGLTERPSDATLTRRIKRAGLTRTLDEVGGLDGAVPEAGAFLGMSFRLRLAALRAAVRRPSLLLVNDGGQALPEDVQGYVDSTSATVVRIAARRHQDAAKA